MLTTQPEYINDYKTYVSQLPLPENILTLLIDTGKLESNPLFYLEYASLFENSFQFNDSSRIVKQLNIAGFLCYKYSLFTDNLLDRNDKSMTIALSNIYLEETIKLLTSIFGLDNAFWLRWNLRKKEFYAASKLGKSFFQKETISFGEYAELCDLKSAMGKIAIDSLDILSAYKNKEAYDMLLESHKLFSIGFQINDDIEDFIEDFINEDFNYANYTFIKNTQDKPEDIVDANKLFYINGTAVELYKLSLTYFHQALDIGKELNEPKWIKAILGKINETESAKMAIEEYLTILRTKVQLKENAVKLNSFNHNFNHHSVLEKGLSYLINEWEFDLPEIKHIMVLTHSEGFKNNQSVHITDTFQRAILVNNLIDISANSKIDLSIIIDHEMNYLIEKRNNDEAGGWSYFSSVREIAADADDLGQIMQILIKGNRKIDIDKYCLKAIRILLDDCYHSDTGGIETWIIPRNNRTEIQQIQAEFNATKWGSGPDVDVMANFLYALSIDNYHLYKRVIENGMRYIVDKNEEICFWNSRWYYGWLYATMLCVRLYKEVEKHHSKLTPRYFNKFEEVKQQIVSKQNKDGGWAIEINGNSDPLNTSLALKTLMYFDNTSEINFSLEKAIHFLNINQNPDGSWNAVPFIKPRLNDPYKSKIITTSYVLNVISQYYGGHLSK